MNNEENGAILECLEDIQSSITRIERKLCQLDDRVNHIEHPITIPVQINAERVDRLTVNKVHGKKNIVGDVNGDVNIATNKSTINHLQQTMENKKTSIPLIGRFGKYMKWPPFSQKHLK